MADCPRGSPAERAPADEDEETPHDGLLRTIAPARMLAATLTGDASSAVGSGIGMADNLS